MEQSVEGAKKMGYDPTEAEQAVGSTLVATKMLLDCSLQTGMVFILPEGTIGKVVTVQADPRPDAEGKALGVYWRLNGKKVWHVHTRETIEGFARVLPGRFPIMRYRANTHRRQIRVFTFIGYWTAFVLAVREVFVMTSVPEPRPPIIEMDAGMTSVLWLVLFFCRIVLLLALLIITLVIAEAIYEPRPRTPSRVVGGTV